MQSREGQSDSSVTRP
nr:unnamed protein product [Callosobruchus chinensis]CAH7747113.1 unnamed protein product [Callosobruchus chinensis]